MPTFIRKLAPPERYAGIINNNFAAKWMIFQ
jgi:hypothetical protein